MYAVRLTHRFHATRRSQQRGARNFDEFQCTACSGPESGAAPSPAGFSFPPGFVDNWFHNRSLSAVALAALASAAPLRDCGAFGAFCSTWDLSEVCPLRQRWEHLGSSMGFEEQPQRTTISHSQRPPQPGCLPNHQIISLLSVCHRVILHR